jgi:hypothetical protein
LNMTLSSLICLAVEMMVRVGGSVVPLPLQRMARALAAIHCYRTVMVVQHGGTEGAGTVMHSDTVCVRHGSVLQRHSIQTHTFQGHNIYAEMVQTDTAMYLRQARYEPWKLSPTAKAAEVAQSDARLAVTLSRLGTSVRWTTVEDGEIEGQMCFGYQAIDLEESQAREEITLWIAHATSLPVKMVAVTAPSPLLGEGARMMTTVTWSEWNDQALAIPSDVVQLPAD